MLVFDRQAARSVDQAAIQEYGIPGMVLMENAARGLTTAALEMIRNQIHPRVLVICGDGNNGGDGYAVARHLHNHQVSVTIASQGEPHPSSDAAVNLKICRNMKLCFIDLQSVDEWNRANRPCLIIDAIFGTGLDRHVTGIWAEIINWMNSAKVPVLAADLPSGMDCDTGEPLGCCVRATRTVTFVGIKQGFLGLDAQKLLGDVTVADIGAPRELLERFGRRVVIRRPDSPERPMDPTAGKPAR